MNSVGEFEGCHRAIHDLLEMPISASQSSLKEAQVLPLGAPGETYALACRYRGYMTQMGVFLDGLGAFWARRGIHAVMTREQAGFREDIPAIKEANAEMEASAAFLEMVTQMARLTRCHFVRQEPVFEVLHDRICESLQTGPTSVRAEIDRLARELDRIAQRGRRNPQGGYWSNLDPFQSKED